MLSKNYFNKHGEIYGISEKCEFGRWIVKEVARFTDYAKAEKWLNTEERDFRERSLVSKTTAIKKGYREGE